MEGFGLWLEKKSIARFTGWFNDGTIIVYIDNKRYTYLIDPIFHDKLKKISRYNPFAAVNEIKKLIELGHAKLIDVRQN